MTDTESKSKAAPSRHAVFDETLQQYVGGVHASKGDAEQAAKGYAKQPRHDGHKLTTRPV